MLRPILAALILATALPAAAETDTLHYNMIEFAESANLEITRDTMTTYFSIASEGKDRATVNKAFQKKFNDFNKAVQNNKLQTEILNRAPARAMNTTTTANASKQAGKKKPCSKSKAKTLTPSTA